MCRRGYDRKECLCYREGSVCSIKNHSASSDIRKSASHARGKNLPLFLKVCDSDRGGGMDVSVKPLTLTLLLQVHT